MSVSLLHDWEREQQRAERRRWLWSTAAVLVAGSAVAVGLQWHPFQHATPLPPAAAMAIELMPLQAPPTPPSEQPEGEQQVEAPKPKPPKPEPKPKPKIQPDLPVSEVSLPDPEEAEPEEEESDLPPAPETRSPKHVDGPASDVAAAPSQSAYSATAVAAAKLTFEQRLLGHLERHKRYPRAAQLRRQQGMPYVRFTMDRAGTVLEAKLERGTGHSLIDEEALALLKRAQPLPALPDEVQGQTLEVVVPIEFFLNDKRR